MDDNFYNKEAKIVPAKSDFINKISFWVLLVVTALIPIFFLPISFVSVQFGTSLLFSIGVIISSILYIFYGIKTGSLYLPNPSKYILGFLFLVPLVYVLAGISNGFSRSIFFGYTFDISTVGFILLSFLYLFLVSILFRDKLKLQISYKALVISTLLFTVFAFIRIFSKGSFFSFGVFPNVTTTTLGSWNNTAILFSVTLLLSLLSLEILNLKKVYKYLSWFAILVSLFFMALVNFSSVWLLSGIFSFLIILYKLFYGEDYLLSQLSWKERFLKISFVPFGVLVLSLIFFFASNSLGVYLASVLKTETIEIRPSFTTTMEIARNTLKLSPIFGSGPNTFINQWSAFKPNDVVSTDFWSVDFPNGIGLIPTFLVTTGIAGLISWLLFIGFLSYLGFKSIFIKIEDEQLRYFLVSSFFVSLFLWFMNFVYVPSTPVFILTFFFTGLFFASVYTSGIISVTSKQFNTNPRLGFVASVLMVSSLVGVIFLGYGLFKNSLSLWYFQRSSYALSNTNNSKLSEEYMLKAIVTVPNDVYYRSLSEIYLYQLNEVLSQDPNQVKQEDIQQQFNDGLVKAITAGVSAKDRDPLNYLNWIALGRIYDAVSIPQLNIQGSYESAQVAYIEALKLNPKNPGILMLLARLAANRNDLNSARNYVAQAIEIKNNYLDAYFLLSQIEVATNNTRGAIQSVTAASVIDPTNPAIFFQLGLLKYNARDFDGAVEAFEKAINIVPEYANAKFFLGLSYEATRQREKAIEQFQDLRNSNPDNVEVNTILTNLLEGRNIFNEVENKQPERGGTLPLRENE